ncbi:MAG: LCP family protein [Oscillospiraceae bacterium]|nr:LCP family protein [Oscillospiraceae bacterium]
MKLRGKRSAPSRVFALLTKRNIIIASCSLAGAGLIAFIIWLITYVSLPPVQPQPTYNFPDPPPLSSNTPSPTTSADPTQIPPTLTPEPEKIYQILFAVRDKQRLTDSLIVANVNCTDKTVDIVNIPRDTRVESANRDNKKINVAYAANGIDGMKKELSELIGFEPHYYVVMNSQCIADLVDLIGGIDFEIPVNMNYDDPTQDLSIHFRKGMTHLTGEDAVLMLRYRDSYGDLGRINTQQNFIKAYAKQALTIENITDLPQFVNIINDKNNLDTNLTLGNLAAFALELRSIDTQSDITAHTIPTTDAMIGGRSYQIADTEKTREIIRDVFGG